MDPSAFDTLVKAHAQSGTRRWLVRLVATLSLGGVLAVAGGGGERGRAPASIGCSGAPSSATASSAPTPQEQEQQHQEQQMAAVTAVPMAAVARPSARAKPAATATAAAGTATASAQAVRYASPTSASRPAPDRSVASPGRAGARNFAACQQTTSGASVCTTLTTNIPCTTDADCGLGAICIKNPPDPSCQGNLPTYCAVNS